MKQFILYIAVVFSFGLVAQVPSYVPQYGLLGYYPFNGNSNDVSANAANLTNNSAVLTADRFGTANSAYSFNGVNQYLINSTPNFTFNPASSFTVSFWYNRNVTSVNGVLIMNATNAAGNFIWIFQAGATNSQFGTNKQQFAWIWAPTPSTTSVWTHIVCVYNAGAMTLYKNNVQVATATFTHTNVTSAVMPLYVGRGVGGDYYNGKMDDIGIWNRALTTCEINDLYNSSNSLTGVSAGPDISSCNNQAITLSGTGAVNYFWNQNVSNGVPFTPTANTTYLVTGFNANGCSQWDETNVTLGQLSINAGQDVSVCPGDTVTLSASGAQSYTWNNSVNNNQAFVVNQSGTYIATGVNGSCTDTDTLQITVLPLPQINAGNDTVLCAGGLVTLNATGGQNYQWTNGVSNAVPFTAFNSASYIVTGFSPAGCANQDTLEVIANPVPNINAGNDVSTCSGQAVVLTGIGGFNLQWNNGVQDGVPFYPTGNGTFVVTGMSNDGCYGTDTLNVSVGNLPDISAGNDQVICQGDSVVLAANGGATYQWSNGEQNGGTIFPTQSITLSVTGFSGEGCSNTDSLSITVNNPSQSTITTTALDTYTLNGNTYTTSGTYTQVLTNAQGCDSTITLILTMEYTGLADGYRPTMNVYPNPTNGELFILVTYEWIDQTAKLTDISGKVIARISLNDALTKLSLVDLASGTYFIAVEAEGCGVIRVVKE
ncbi:MAG: T9SS type A sorting domain-containing protein [Crocinitomicaceae bacterium]|nr:T9SS type A sorting domain-containing protein [Crocinitomicaceae bacterium]MBP6032097.1 T9SS type A sorting domain-containing protein [Crocinitomicaceae bacterium]